MGKRLIFKEGDPVGDYGVTYLYDLSDYIKPDGKPDRVCRFRCSCGKHFTALLRSVRHNATKSCGHRAEEFIANLNVKDITNQKFGKLTAKYPTGEVNKSGQRYWYCDCDCGGHKVVVASELLAGRCNSCGCISSLGEEKITQILNELDINFIKQYNPVDCINPHTNKRLSFDFYLPDDNILIEYDGEQHYAIQLGKLVFYKTKEEALEAKFRDIIKNQYAYKRKIHLIRIPYRHFDILDSDYILRRTNAKKQANWE